jgi:hypothetical protein
MLLEARTRIEELSLEKNVLQEELIKEKQQNDKLRSELESHKEIVNKEDTAEKEPENI